jgi:membrane protein/epoxyqueuosine reductase
VSIVSNSGTVAEATTENPIVTEVPECATTPAVAPAQLSKWFRLRQDGTALVKYLLDSEVHTFAFSVAANAILSFIPLVVLLYTLAMSVFHSQAMVGVVNDMVNYFLPSVTRQPGWVATNIENAAAMSSRHGVQAFSLIMILISCTGIFLPLEVALNQAWGVAKSRNYLLNQVVAFGLAIIMVVLGIIAISLSAAQRQILDFLFFHKTDTGFLHWVFAGISYMWLALCSGAACILFFFCIYWLLPNCKVPVRPVLRASVVVGLIWLGARYIFVALLPHLDLKSLYGPFYISVGLLFWAYVSGLILFAGAQYSVKQLGPREK